MQLSGPGEVEFGSIQIRPLVQHPTDKFGSVIHPQALRLTARPPDGIESLHRLINPKARSRSYRKGLSRVAVHHRQDPERTPAKEISDMKSIAQPSVGTPTPLPPFEP
jgi:hypothetical protein